MRRLLLAIRLFAVSWLTAPYATAQDYIPGTVPYETALEAVRLNSRNYGIVGALERNILPELEGAEDGHFFLSLEHNHLWNAMQVPAVDMNSGSAPWPVRMAHLDLIGTSTSLGYSFGSIKVFGGWSMTGTQSQLRIIDPVFAPVVNSALGWVIPFTGNGWNNFVRESNSYGPYDRIGRSTWMANHNWMVGALAEAGPVRLRAGFIGSIGIYTGASVPDLGAFAQTALTDEFKNLSYLRAGFDGLSQPTKDLAWLGLYVRKLNWNVSPVPPALGAEVAFSDIRRQALWSTHLDLINIIGKMLDVGAAVTLQPVTDLHEAHLTVHTPGFHGEYDSETKRSRLKKNQDAFGLTAGIVKLPNLYFYGVEGGTRLTFSAQMKGRHGKLILRMNDPEILSVFPFAYNAVNFYFQLGGDLNE
jgi:hypothetical protein